MSCVLHAELVDLYMEVGGNAWAFEERAALPKGIVTAGQSSTAKSQDDGNAAHASEQCFCLPPVAELQCSMQRGIGWAYADLCGICYLRQLFGQTAMLQ